jgi:hypothetical protein
MDDARAFTTWLTSPDGGGLPEANVQLVPVQGAGRKVEDARPWTTDVYDALDRANDAVEKQVKADPKVWSASRLYLFVAGHGIAPGDGQGALLVANATMRKLGYNVELTLQHGWYSKFGPFREVVIFADCCRINKPFVPGNGPPFSQVFSSRPEDVRIVLGWGSVLGGQSFDGPVDRGDPDERRGYFTEALLAGLGGGPRDPFLGAITVATLNGFVAERVKQRARRDGRRQTASITGPDDFTFGTGAATAPPGHGTAMEAAVTLVFPPGFADGAVIRDRTLRVVESSTPAPPRWIVRLPPGQYQVTTVDPDGRPHDRNGFVGDGIIIAAGVDIDVQL